MNGMVAVTGTEPDDVIPTKWGAYLNPRNGAVVFAVHPYMECYGYNVGEHDVLDTTAGALSVGLRDLLDLYIAECVGEDYGEGLLPLANLFSEYAEKLRNRKIEIRKDVHEQKEYDRNVVLVVDEHSPDASITKNQANEDSSNTAANEMIYIEKSFFKEILELVLNLPEFSGKLTTIDVDFTTTPAGEALMRLKPSDFLLRLNAALRTCG